MEPRAVLALGPLSVFSSGNPVTPFVLAKTLFVQLGILGVGVYLMAIYVVPYLAKYQGVHAITPEEKEAIRNSVVLRPMFSKAKRWYDHMWFSLASTALKIVGVFALGLTLFILLTDVGWLKAWQTYVQVETYGGTSIVSGWQMALLMARAAGAPNGAHLLSYIPLPILGIYVAYKYRNTSTGNSYCGDVYQGILIVAFGVAIHELIWLVGYYAKYAVDLSLATLPNLAEDLGFAGMCILFVFAFKKYPFRTIPFKLFIWPIVGYALFIELWYFFDGMKVTTVNNWQIGQGIYMTTQYWADPLTNFIEVVSWIYIAASFFVVIKHAK